MAEHIQSVLLGIILWYVLNKYYMQWQKKKIILKDSHRCYLLIFNILKTSHTGRKRNGLLNLPFSMIIKTIHEKMSTCLKGKKKKIQTWRRGRGKQTRIQNFISNLGERDNELVSPLFLSLFPQFFSLKKIEIKKNKKIEIKKIENN